MLPNVTQLTQQLLQALDTNYNVIDMAAVLEIIGQLEQVQITKELLETTRLGRHVNELRRRTTNEILSRRAKDLVKKWRNLVLPPLGSSAQHIPASNTSVTNQTDCANERVNVPPNVVVSTTPGLKRGAPVMTYGSGMIAEKRVKLSNNTDDISKPVPAGHTSGIKAQQPPNIASVVINGTNKKLRCDKSPDACKKDFRNVIVVDKSVQEELPTVSAKVESSPVTMVDQNKGDTQVAPTPSSQTTLASQDAEGESFPNTKRRGRKKGSRSHRKLVEAAESSFCQKLAVAVNRCYQVNHNSSNNYSASGSSRSNMGMNVISGQTQSHGGSKRSGSVANVSSTGGVSKVKTTHELLASIKNKHKHNSNVGGTDTLLSGGTNFGSAAVNSNGGLNLISNRLGNNNGSAGTVSSSNSHCNTNTKEDLQLKAAKLTERVSIIDQKLNTNHSRYRRRKDSMAKGAIPRQTHNINAGNRLDKTCQSHQNKFSKSDTHSDSNIPSSFAHERLNEHTNCGTNVNNEDDEEDDDDEDDEVDSTSDRPRPCRKRYKNRVPPLHYDDDVIIVDDEDEGDSLMSEQRKRQNNVTPCLDVTSPPLCSLDVETALKRLPPIDKQEILAKMLLEENVICSCPVPDNSIEIFKRDEGDGSSSCKDKSNVTSLNSCPSYLLHDNDAVINDSICTTGDDNVRIKIKSEEPDSKEGIVQSVEERANLLHQHYIANVNGNWGCEPPPFGMSQTVQFMRHPRTDVWSDHVEPVVPNMSTEFIAKMPQQQESQLEPLRTPNGSDRWFSEWHQVLATPSYNNETLRILPYCIID